MSEMRTFTYVVDVKTADGENKLKGFKFTLQGLNRESEVAAASMNKLGAAIGEKLGKKVSVTVDNTHELKQTLSAAAREAARSEKNYNRLSGEYKNLTARTGKTAAQQEKMNALQRLGAGATLTQKKAIINLVKAQQEQVKVSGKVQGSMRGLRGQAQNLGWQLQDVAVQAQMGTNALVILGQQGSQLASGFGATGALIGAGIAVGAALVGVAISALKAKKGIGNLEKITTELNKAFREGSSGADLLSNRILELAKKSEALAKIEISKGIFTAEKQIKTAISSIIDIIDDVDIGRIGDGFDAAQISTGKSVDQILASTKRLGDLGGSYFRGLETSVKKVQDEFKITRAQAAKLGIALDRAIGDKSALSIKSLQNALEDLNVETGGTNKKVVELAGKLISLFGSVSTGIDRTTLLKLAFSDLSSAVKEANDDVDKVKLWDIGSTPVDFDYFHTFIKTRQKTLDDQFVIDLGRAKQARDLGVGDEDDYQAKILEIKTDYNKKAVDAKRKLEAKYTGAGRLTELARQHDTELKMAMGNAELVNEINKHYADERIKINGSVWEKMAVSAKSSLDKTDKMMDDSMERLTSGTADAFASAVVGADNFGDAIEGVFKGAIQSAIAYFAELAIQQALSWAFTSAGETAAGIGHAQTITLLAQAKSIEAGLNAFTSTAAIPIVGAALAPAAGAAAIAATQPMAGTIAALATASIPTFDKGGYIPSGGRGIVSEYGDELVGGTMVYNGSPNSLKVTGREDTAKMSSGNKNTFNINSYGNASPEAIARAVARAVKKGTKAIDNAVYDSMNRGRKNKGKRFA